MAKFDLMTRLILNAAGFKTGVDKASKDAKALSVAVDQSTGAMKGAFGTLIDGVLPNFAGQLGDFGSLINGVKGAIGGLSVAAKTVKAAIVSTGIGAILIVITTAIAGLIAWMKRTDEGADGMRKAFDIVKSVIQVVLTKLTALGTAIVRLFQGDFKGAADSAKEAVTGWGDAIKRNIELAKQLNATQDKLEDYDETYALRRETIEERITSLSEQATNMQDKSAKERLAASEQLKKEEEKLYNLKKGKVQLELNALREEISMGADNQDNRQKINDKEAELVSLRSEYNMGLKASNKLINKNIDDAAKEVKQEKWQAEYKANPLQPMKGKEGRVVSNTKSVDITKQDLSKTISQWDKLKKKISESKEAADMFSSSFVSLGDTMSAMIEGQEGAFRNYIGEVLAGIRKLLLANLAKAIMGLFGEEASTKGLAGIALAAGGAVVLSGLYAKWAGSFAGGGIIPGYSYSGDQLTANVNSAEMILNRGQQANLFNMINTGRINNSKTEIKLKLERGDLIATLNLDNLYKNRY